MLCSTSVLCCGTGLYRGDRASVFTKTKLVSFLGFHTHGKLLSRSLLLVNNNCDPVCDNMTYICSGP
jgi:hypothetical protein